MKFPKEEQVEANQNYVLSLLCHGSFAFEAKVHNNTTVVSCQTLFHLTTATQKEHTLSKSWNYIAPIWLGGFHPIWPPSRLN